VYEFTDWEEITTVSQDGKPIFILHDLEGGEVKIDTLGPISIEAIQAALLEWQKHAKQHKAAKSKAKEEWINYMNGLLGY